jgi:DNA polymerase III epsilon subunit-like protein
MKFAVADTETTGLTAPSVQDIEKQPRIIELGLAIVECGEIRQFNWLINPEELLSEEQTKHAGGITNEMLKDKPTFRELLPEIEEAFGGSEMLICHNAPFDVALIHYELQRCGRTGFPWPAITVCTVQEYQHEFGHRPKLTDLYEKKLGRPLAQTHRAIDDVMALVEILQHEQFFETMEAI